MNDTKALRAEKLFLKLDLVFPVFYGAALAGGLLLAWAWLGRPFNPGFAIAPVVIMVVADWVENLVQFNQLQRYEEGRLADLSPDWVQIASVATITKLAFFGIIVLFLFALVVLLFCRTPDPV